MNVFRVISRFVFNRRRYHHVRMCWRIAAGAMLAAVFSVPALAANTTVHIITTLGPIDIQLYDDQAPKTVANFLRYAGRGDYSTNGIIYRSVPGFVIQAGGYVYEDIPSPFGLFRYFFHIPTDPPVQNEFSPSRSNVRGTIAMAKLPGNPDSATSDWFINLADNSANLDYQNGGFTVFGNVIDTVLDPGMSVVDAIANLPILDASNPAVTCSILCNLPIPAFNTLPVINYNPATGLDPSNLVMVTSIPNVTASKMSTTGTTSAYAAEPDMTFTSGAIIPNTTAVSWLAAFIPPPGKTVQFNDGISRFTITGTMGPAGRVVTLYHGAATGVNRYFAYGPTPDNPTPHWYDFTFDGATGAEFVGNQILLHFIDGQRGDDDLLANGSITHTGAPVLVTDIPTGSTSSAGCSIAATPSQMRGNSDWVVVSMFLAFVALVRRRSRLDRSQE